MAGGDRAIIAFAVEAGARVVAAIQAAEPIHRGEGEPTRVETRLGVAAGVSLAWIPQGLRRRAPIALFTLARRRARREILARRATSPSWTTARLRSARWRASEAPDDGHSQY
jgi:hypothetical protein